MKVMNESKHTYTHIVISIVFMIDIILVIVCTIMFVIIVINITNVSMKDLYLESISHEA